MTAPTLPLNVALQQAIAHHQAGRLPEAEALYRAILQAQPNHAEANHNLGILAGQVGQHALGLPHLKAALDANPAQEQYWRSYAEALLASGQAKAAHTLLQKAVQHGFKTPAVHTLRQQAKAAVQHQPVKDAAPSPEESSQLVALFNAGRYEEMEHRARLLVGQYPESGFAWKALGTALQMQDKETLPALQKAAKFLPEDAEVHNNLGAVLKNLGQFDHALVSYRRALELKPNLAEAYSNQGNVLRNLGQLNDAVASYHRALEIKPDLAEVHGYLGTILRDLGQLNKAAVSTRRALEINPDLADAHCNLGSILRDLGQLDKALASTHRALEIQPDFAEAHTNLGNVLHDLGQLDEALASYRRALAIQPNYADAYTNLLFSLISSETADASALLAEHRRFAEQFEAPLRASWPQHRNAREPERCLHIGLVSGDLRNHAVASFLEPVLAHLATAPQLALHAYYNHPIEDRVSLRLRGYFAHWHSIAALSDDALAQKIMGDGIDILIDLSGHTGHNRLLTFARKPAPLQASWIGHPSTTGLQAMDYYVTDRCLLPPGQFDAQFTEKLIDLPAWASFRPFEGNPPVQPLPAAHTGYLTFGSFNRPNKISRSIIALWSKLLRALPEARMVLGSMPPNDQRNPLREWFAQEGIARERLSFYPRSDMETYLALHHQIDICLDTFPFSGCTVTNHALLMGVPTLTLAGHTAAGRQGAGILSHLGLEAFIAQEATDFVAKGVFWAGHLDALADLRAGLRERFEQSPIGQSARIAAALERALRLMWQRWCVGLPAASFAVDSKPLDGISPHTALAALTS